jgi:hypothetical protein
MFRYDLMSLFHWWKAAGDKILLMGDFNKNIYSGPIALALLEDELWLSKICRRTTGEHFLALMLLAALPLMQCLLPWV